MKTLLPYLKSYRVAIAIAIFLTFVELTVELTQPLFIAKIINEGILPGDLGAVLKWGGVMLGFAFLAFAAGITSSFYAAHVSQSYGFDIRNHLFEKIAYFSQETFQRLPASSLITRLTNDVAQTQQALFMGLRIMLRAPLLIGGGVILSLLVDWKLGLILLGTVPILVFLIFGMVRKGRSLFQTVQAKLDRVNSAVRESLMRTRLIRAFNTESHETALFTKASENLRDRSVTALRFMELIMPLSLLLMNVSIILVLWFGSGSVLIGAMNEGDLVAIVNYATRITATLPVFTMIVSMFTRSRASANRIADVLRLSPDRPAADQNASPVEPIRGDIAFERVSFSYPQAEREALRNVSFHVNPGEKVAILGETGSGKSTLFQLIARLYEPTKGTIRIDGKDARHIDEESLRAQIGYVSQTPHLFSGTILENLRWGKEDATMDDVAAAAKDAQIYDFIASLPDGFDTIIGQKGVNLSGGQKQRIAIARALIRQPRLLLLDDCTSALDAQTEQRFIEALDASYDGSTLIITQKVSSAMTADRVLLVHDGQIAAEGDHETLLKRSDRYRHIYESQHRKGTAHYV